VVCPSQRPRLASAEGTALASKGRYRGGLRRREGTEGRPCETSASGNASHKMRNERRETKAGRR